MKTIAYWVLVTREPEDYSLSNNGGDYKMWERYYKEGDRYRIEYHTSADFTYCPNCGSFNDHGEECRPEYIDSLPEGAEPRY